MQHLQRIAAQEHPLGSPAQAEIGRYLSAQAEQLGATVFSEEFVAETPNPVLLQSPDAPASPTLRKNGRNIYARANFKADADCVVLVGSHYDTKIIDGHPYLGANDSGSSSALLLEILRRLHKHPDNQQLACDLMLVWFDGEESILPDWNDGERRHPARIQDNTYGSRHAVSRLRDCKTGDKAQKCLPVDLGGATLVALVLVDMVGSPALKFTREQHSSPQLMQKLEAILQVQGRRHLLGDIPIEVGDDHLPYVRAGVPAIDLIDFVNTTHWHQPSDVIANVSPPSLEVAYEVATALALLVARGD